MRIVLTDYHSHLLPGMDDGAKDISVTKEMLTQYKHQGVERMIATPHFYPLRESAERFLRRREGAFAQLEKTNDDFLILPGAEIRIEKRLSEIGLMSELTLAGSQYVLLELPYAPFREWMITEIYQIMYNFNLIPVLAHVERYQKWYTRDEMRRILTIQDSILQINYEALQTRSTAKLAMELVQKSFPVIFGSDAHNTDDRPPNVEDGYRLLKAKLNENQWDTLMTRNRELL